MLLFNCQYHHVFVSRLIPPSHFPTVTRTCTQQDIKRRKDFNFLLFFLLKGTQDIPLPPIHMYADLYTILAGSANTDSVPDWCAAFKGDSFNGASLIAQIELLLSGRVESLTKGNDEFCSTVYSASSTASEPLVSLVLVQEKYRIVVWSTAPLTDLPDGVNRGVTQRCCTVLDVDSIERASFKSIVKAIVSAIKNAPMTLAGRLQAQSNVVASERRLKWKLKPVELLPVPSFFFVVPDEKVLRPFPKYYVPANCSALLKQETLDPSPPVAPKGCQPCAVFDGSSAVRVAVFRGASGSGKTMGALHAMDRHEEMHPNSAVLGLYTNTRLQLDTFTWKSIANKIAEQAIGDLERWDKECSNNLRGAPSGLGNLIVYLVADELGSYPEVAGCIIKHHGEIEEFVKGAILKAFGPEKGAATDDGFRLYVSMAGTGLGLRADCSGGDSLPRNYQLVLAESYASCNKRIVETEMRGLDDFAFLKTVEDMCCEENPDPSRNLLPSLITNARCAAFVGRHLKALFDRFVRSREGIEDAMGMLLNDVSASYVRSNAWSDLNGELHAFEDALTSLISLAVTQPRGFHLLDEGMIIMLVRRLGAISDVAISQPMAVIPSAPLPPLPNGPDADADWQTEEWVRSVGATRSRPSAAAQPFGAASLDERHGTLEVEPLATLFDVSPAVVLIALQQRANDTLLRSSRAPFGYEAFAAAVVTSAVDCFRRFLRAKKSSAPVPLHLIFGGLRGHAAGRQTIQLLPPDEAPLPLGEWVIHPTQDEVKSFGAGYDSWWPGEFAKRVAAIVKRNGVALVFAGDGSPHRDGLLCTREMIVDFDARFHCVSGEVMEAMGAAMEGRYVLGFHIAKVTFKAERVTDSQWGVVGPVAAMLESQSGGELSCVDEEAGMFSLQSVAESPCIAFKSAKALFDMLDLDGKLAEMNNGVKPQRVSLLLASHVPLIPTGVEICLGQRMAYAPGGAKAIVQMAEEVYPQRPSKALKKSETVQPKRNADASADSESHTADDWRPVFGFEFGYNASDKSTCHVASCVMSLKATLSFCEVTRDPLDSAPSSVAEWPLDGKLGGEGITMFKKVSHQTLRLQCSADGKQWEWESDQNRTDP